MSHHPSAHPCQSRLLSAVLLLLAGCGGDGGGHVVVGGSADAITVILPATPSGVVPVGYTLPGGGDAVVEFSVDQGASWSGAAPAPGCATTKQLTAGSHSFLWDSVADGDLASGAILVRVRSGSATGQAGATLAASSPTFLERSAAIDAGAVSGTYQPANRGHYDLSPVVLNYTADPAFAMATAQVPVKSWRISVGRWEVGPTSVFAPEAAAYSTDPNQLRSASREFYRGPNTLAGAADPANYHFAYLDAQIRAVTACDATPYLCFDYMPFTLAANQDPNTSANLYLHDAMLSFSNGIRTSPPSDNAIYAEVVKRTVMHVTGSFANGLGVPLTQVEIGNEPDLIGGSGMALNYFYTGTSAQFTATYQACAAALDAQFGTSLAIIGGSFAFIPGEAAPTFMQRFLAGLGSTRLDALAFHCYSDSPETGFTQQILAAKTLRDTYKPGAKLFCPEWSMDLGNSDLTRFQTMTAALHNAKVLEYFALLDVSLAHRALLRDPVADHIGLIGTDAALKPAAYAFKAYEMLAQTPNLCGITTTPSTRPMIISGKAGSELTVIFFHEAPPAGQVGRLSLSLANLPAGSWTARRSVLSDATVGIGDGLWSARVRSGSGAFSDELRFTRDTLVVWRLSSGGALSQAAVPRPAGNG